jgi:hypothetical protein
MNPTSVPERTASTDEDVTVPEESIQTPVRDRQQRQAAADITDIGRCPLCRTPLVFRMDCLGPYEFCRCGRRRRS